jgi:hypothetical protein
MDRVSGRSRHVDFCLFILIRMRVQSNSQLPISLPQTLQEDMAPMVTARKTGASSKKREVISLDDSDDSDEVQAVP